MRKGLNMNQFSDWEVGQDYELVKLLGQGSYGQVASAVHKPTGKKVAIKKMDGVFEDDVDCKRILREVTLLRRLKHPYVVELFDIIEPKNLETFDTLYVVLELAESDLKKVIKSAIHLQLKHIQLVIYNLFCAVRYLHSANVLHRDLKPANILVNEDCSVKICDFGLARSIAGVESASLMLSGSKRFANKDDEEMKTDDGHEDVVFKHTEPAQMHHQD
jgi:mitogen-activated protein kinase 1/3